MTRARACALAIAAAAALKILALTGALVVFSGCTWNMGHGPSDVESPMIPGVTAESSPKADADPDPAELAAETAARAAREKAEESADDRLDRLCDAKTRVDVGPADVTFTGYPCEVAKTQAAVDATQGKGVIMGAIPRFFLRCRLVTRGIFSSVFGLLGVGATDHLGEAAETA